MDWSDSVFREQPAYYGDINYSKQTPVGDDGIALSAKWMAFRHEGGKIGLLSSRFDRNIEEKLAQGRKAEYGSKVYTTVDMPSLALAADTSANVLAFDPFDWNRLQIGDSAGTLSIFNISSPAKPETVLSAAVMPESTPLNCLAAHPQTAAVLAVGGAGQLRVVDLEKGAATLCSTPLLSEDDAVLRLSFADSASSIRGITSGGLSFLVDPRSAEKLEVTSKHTFAPCSLSSLDGVDSNLVAMAGLTPFLEPIVYALDVRKMGAGDFESSHVYKRAFSHKQCRPMLSVDGVTGLLYVAFESCADLLALNCRADFEKQALYHSVDDTFMAMAVSPKNTAKKREINRMVKWGKTRIQQLVHSRGGKPIYATVSSAQRASAGSADAYMSSEALPEAAATCTLVAADYEEAKRRAVSVFTHIKGAEPNTNLKQYYDLQVSKTVSTNLGLNIRRNAKLAAFPAPTFGGGALGVITLDSVGRKRQLQITAHADKISTFDVCQLPGREGLVLTGSPDCKAQVHRVDAESKTTKKLFTLACCGKVGVVRFHPRVDGLCAVAANKEGAANPTSMLYLWNYLDGELVREVELRDTKDVADVAFEGAVGLVAAVSSRKGKVALVDVREGRVLRSFTATTSQRDTKLFWMYGAADADKRGERGMSTLVCLGFAKGSLRKFELFDVADVVDACYADKVEGFVAGAAQAESKEAEADGDEDEKGDEWPRRLGEMLLGVSNSVPLGYMDAARSLLFVSAVGDRKVRAFEVGASIKEMGIGAAFQSKSDIVGLAFARDDEVDVRRVETAQALTLHKEGVVSPVSFSLPRKRREFFQDDVYGDTLDAAAVYAIEVVSEDYAGKVAAPKYKSLCPDGMELLSEAPKEADTQRQKRRKSQIALMEANKLREQAGSMEQSFDQFSRMVADAPTANRWDAQNIGTEVADDEWDD